MNGIIKRKIDKNDVISFDLFDTLIKRDVSEPQNIYTILQNEINEVNFSEKRFAAEMQLWRQEEEFNIYNIYKLLGYSNEEANRLVAQEFKLECAFSRRNEAMAEIYDYCLKKKKIVIITTDTFWGETHIRTLLDKNNLGDYSALFVSSNWRATKNTGKLFKIIKQRYPSKKILHIGDSMKSDFIMPRLTGIGSYKISRSVNNLKYLDRRFMKWPQRTIGDDVLVSSLNNMVMTITDEPERIGYEVLGPLLLGYLTCVKEKSKELKIDKIVFLARDGFIMNKAFSFFDNNEMNFGYFYASRASMYSVLLDNVSSFTDIPKIVKFRQREKISEILKDVGIERMKDEDASLADIEITRCELSNKNNRYLALLDKYIPQIRETSSRSRGAFGKYLTSELKNNKRILVADVGWHGTIQDYLTVFSKKNGKEFDFSGCYIGLDYRNMNDKNKYSYAFGNNGLPFRSDQVFGYRGVIETFFSANHGTTLSYREDSNVAVPVFEKYCQDSYTQSFISKVHRGALNYVKDFQKRYGEIGLTFSSEVCFGFAYKLMTCPKKADLDLIRNVSFSDRGNTRLIPGTKKYYFLHPIRMMNDFMNSDWKFGFARFICPFFNLSGFLTRIYRLKGKNEKQ